MDRYTIEMNFTRAREQAGQLETAAGQLEKIATGNMEEVLSSIMGNWKGENADVYLGKARKVQKDILSVSKELKNTATAIRHIAQVTYQAEMAALELALKRNV